MIRPFSQIFISEVAKQIASGEIKSPVFEIASINTDKTILVRFKDAANLYAPGGQTASYFDRYDMEVALQLLADAAGKPVEWVDLTADGRGSKIRPSEDA